MAAIGVVCYSLLGVVCAIFGKPEVLPYLLPAMAVGASVYALIFIVRCTRNPDFYLPFLVMNVS